MEPMPVAPSTEPRVARLIDANLDIKLFKRYIDDSITVLPEDKLKDLDWLLHKNKNQIPPVHIFTDSKDTYNALPITSYDQQTSIYSKKSRIWDTE